MRVRHGGPRRLPVGRAHRPGLASPPGPSERPWLLRPFDRLRFVPVEAAELAEARAAIKAGGLDLDTSPATFALAECEALEAAHGPEIAATRARRRAAFDAERERWAAGR